MHNLVLKQKCAAQQSVKSLRYGGYGRFAGAREFTRVIDSFVYAPNNPVFDTPAGLTVEAWVLAHAYGQYEDTPIAARWTEEGSQ